MFVLPPAPFSSLLSSMQFASWSRSTVSNIPYYFDGSSLGVTVENRINLLHDVRTHIKKVSAIVARINEIQAYRYADENRAREIAIRNAGLEESWIIERVKYAIELGLRDEPVLNAEGRPTGQFTGRRNLKAAIDGLRLVSDFNGMRIQRHEIGQPGDFQRMSDDELDESLAAQARALGLPETAIKRLLSLRGPSETIQ